MLALIALLGCTQTPISEVEAVEVADAAYALSVIPETVRMPAGQAIYRPECFSSPELDSVMGGVRPPARGAAPSVIATTGSSRPRRDRESRKADRAPRGSADDASSVLFGAEPMTESAAMPEPEPAPNTLSDYGSLQDEEEAYDPHSVQLPHGPPAEPTRDWGATVYLSNDDSMSLASAQRVLWDVQNGRTPSMQEIRPHELLNYFTFDTAPVSGSDLFSVQGSAARTGDDTLSVALAVKGDASDRQPLDLTVVLDRSGSMSAEGRMEYLKRGLHLAEGELQPGDRVDVVLFDNTVCTPLEDYVVGRDDPSLLTRTIDQLQPRGSTNLDAGLREGYRLASAREAHRRNQRVMLVTDAFLNTGSVDPDVVSEVARNYEDRGIRLTGVGVGREFNDDVLNKLTEKGKGAYVYLGSEAVVDRLFSAGFESLTRTIAHDVHFALELPEGLAMERFYGEESSTVKADVQPIHYYAGTSQLFLQDLTVDPARLRPRDDITVRITYRDATTDEPAEQVVRMRVSDLTEADPHNLDKARALMAWTDVLMERAMGGDACGTALDTYRRRAVLLSDDAEIGYVNSLVQRTCPGFEAVPDPATVAYKVTLDTDQPIAEVQLACGSQRVTERLSSSDRVARFDTVPGECQLVLQGVVPMRVAVQVPETGGQLRCVVRGGRLACN